jgi:hypothetical protein
MAAGFKIELKVSGAEGMTKKKLNDITKEALRSTGRRWHEEYLAGHFTKAGAQKYGYGARNGEPGSGAPLKRSYTAYKQKKKGHSDPLVFSGKGKTEALANKIVKARISSKMQAAVVTISLPRVFNFNLRRAGRGNTNANEEIRRVSNDELRDLESHLAKVLEQLYEKEGRQVKTEATLSR